MIKQVNKFSLEEILSPNKSKSIAVKKSEEPISENVVALLSNVSKTIGIVAYERKVTLKKKIPQIPLSVSKTS